MRFGKLVVAPVFALALLGCGGSAGGDGVDLSKPRQVGRIGGLDANLGVLVVSGSATEGPDGMWYRMGSGADLVAQDGSRNYAFSDLKVGWQVRAWNTGMEEDSLPALTEGRRLEIVSEDIGVGDFRGTIQSVKSGYGASLQLDSSNYLLVSWGDVLLNGEASSASELRVGDEVDLWTTSYHPDGVVWAIQANILRP
jgi:hypothetical protein